MATIQAVNVDANFTNPLANFSIFNEGSINVVYHDIAHLNSTSWMGTTTQTMPDGIYNITFDYTCFNTAWGYIYLDGGTDSGIAFAAQGGGSASDMAGRTARVTLRVDKGGTQHVQWYANANIRDISVTFEYAGAL